MQSAALKTKLLNLAPVRKSRALVMQVPRAIARVSSGHAREVPYPPVLLNSLPKSGTHLLMQLLLALPGYRSYGSFIATTPSISMIRRPDRSLVRSISKLAPGEVCGAHLYYSEDLRDAIRERSAVSLFIYRDPRDVFWSEMQYLLHMNRWHRAGRAARRIDDEESRFFFFLRGHVRSRGGFDWPAFSERVRPYLGWLADRGTFCCRYEDFQDASSRASTLSALATHLQQHSPGLASLPHASLVRTMAAAIRPEASHTFRSGRRHEWQLALPAHHIQALEDEVAGLSAIHFRPPGTS